MQYLFITEATPCWPIISALPAHRSRLGDCSYCLATLPHALQRSKRHVEVVLHRQDKLDAVKNFFAKKEEGASLVEYGLLVA